jgi:FKBP-type peptidyl-prolyl cis-trans isomerase SlyD
MVIPGLEREVLGMKINDEKNIVIEPQDAYGDYNDELIHAFPRSDAGSFTPEVGMTLSVQLADGSYRPAKIKDVTDESIFLDLNHPLAGKRLHLNVTLVEINDEPKYGHGCSDCSGGSQSHGCSDGGCCC